MSSALYLEGNWRCHGNAAFFKDSFALLKDSYHVWRQSRRRRSAAIRRAIGEIRLMDRRRNWFHLGPTHPLPLDSAGSSHFLRLSTAQRRTVHRLFKWKSIQKSSIFWGKWQQCALQIQLNLGAISAFYCLPPPATFTTWYGILQRIRECILQVIRRYQHHKNGSLKEIQFNPPPIIDSRQLPPCGVLINNR